MNNSMRFMENIEELVQRTKMTYIDAVLYYCEENKLEPETAGQMVGGKLKQHIQEEAESLNLVQKTSKLPIWKESNWWRPLGVDKSEKYVIIRYDD